MKASHENRRRFALAVGMTVVASLTSLVACVSTRGEPSLPSRDYAGHYVGGNDANWFRSCADSSLTPADSVWWAVFTDAAGPQLDSLRSSGQIPVGVPRFMRVRAAISNLQPAGPEGHGRRYIYIRDIITVRASSKSDCPTQH